MQTKSTANSVSAEHALRCTFRCLPIVALVAVVTASGCSEGPLWKVSRAAPWVQQKWEAEEKLAETVYSKRRKLQVIAENAHTFSSEESDSYASKLGQIIEAESTLVVRVEAVRALAQVKGQVADAVMIEAVRAPELDVRIAAVQGFKYRGEQVAVGILQEVVDSDTDDDVRREALRSLANFEGPQVVAVLGSVLNDRDPATQYRAVESLEEVTGKDLGTDVRQWREYVAAVSPVEESTSIAGRESALAR